MTDSLSRGRHGHALGPREVPQVIVDLRDDLAVEIDLHMRRNGIRMRDLRDRFGYGARQLRDLSAYLRGDGGWSGHLAALTLAQRLGIPVSFQIGDEAKRARRRTEPKLLPPPAMPLFSGAAA